MWQSGVVGIVAVACGWEFYYTECYNECDEGDSGYAKVYFCF